MIKDFDSKARAAVLMILVALGLLLLQHTRFAFLPPGADGFLRGFAFGIALVMVIAYFTNKAGKPKSL